MRGNEFLINYGGEWLDVDAQSVGGFDFTTLWTLDSTRATEKGRTMDLSVPATKKNTMAFNSHKLIPGEGMRRGINGMVVAGGVNITGKIYVTEYSGGRYSLMMAYGNDFAGFGDVYYRTAFASDTMAFSGKEKPVTNGAVPNFGWYEYYNAFHPHTVTNSPPALHPCTNLGHVIDSLAAYFGYTVNYPDIALGRGYQAHAYGLVLPSFGVQSIQGGSDVSGSAMGGFSYTLSGAATLADLGLEVVTLEAVRGYTIQVVSIEYLRATKPVHISIPDNSNVVVFGRNPYDLHNDWEGTQGAEFDLSVGDVFSFARPDEWHTVAGEYYWNRYRVPPAFEGNVTVTFSVTRAAEYPAPGDTMYLAYALPEHPLEWWLDAYCNIIFAAWTVDEDTKTITVKTYGERLGDALADAGKHIALEKEKVMEMESVKRYIDGFAQHNHTRCAGDYEGLGSVYPFDRDLRMDNDYLPQSRDMEEIPFNDGGVTGGGDERYYLDINDVYKDSGGNYVYDGILTVFFENTQTSDGAVHLTEILNLGIGLGMEKAVSSSVSTESNPISYDPDYVLRTASTNLGYAFAGIDSTNYAQLQCIYGEDEVSYIFYNFNFNIPSGAVIDSVDCKVKCYRNANTGYSDCTLQLYSGSTPKGVATAITSNQTIDIITLTPGSWTAAELNAAKLRFYAKRDSTYTQNNRYLRLYGATLTVEYTVNGVKRYAVSSAFSASVRLLLPLFRFAQLDGGSCVSFHGRNFVVKNAKWSEGVAQLELIYIPPLIPVKNMMLRTLSITNVTCFDGADGEIQVEAINGTAPYTYSLNADFSDSNNTGVFTGLAITGPVQEGTDQYGGIVYCYKTIYVRDADGNTASGSVRLQSPVELGWLDVPGDMTVYCDDGQSYATVDLSMIHPSTTANNFVALPPGGVSPDNKYYYTEDAQHNPVPQQISYYGANDCGEEAYATFTITVLQNP